MSKKFHTELNYLHNIIYSIGHSNSFITVELSVVTRGGFKNIFHMIKQSHGLECNFGNNCIEIYIVS